jgi:MFS family permease
MGRKYEKLTGEKVEVEVATGAATGNPLRAGESSELDGCDARLETAGAGTRAGAGQGAGGAGAGDADNCSARSGVMSIDDAVEATPIGVFHYRLLLMCGLAYMLDAIEVSLLSFVVVMVAKDWDLSIVQTSSIAATVFAGSMVGNVFLWGPLGDIWGRRKTFIAGSALVCFSGICTSIAPNFNILLVCNLFVGIGVGCVFISLDLLAELLPVEWRGLFLMSINYFWTIGSMFVACMAWLLLDAYGWRVLIMSAALPAVGTVVLALAYLPESPRWLMLQGRTAEANELLDEINQMNGRSKSGEGYEGVPKFDLIPLTAEERQHSGESDEAGLGYIQLLSPKYRNTTILLGILSLCWGLTYNGTVIFLSSMFADDSSGDASGEVAGFNASSVERFLAEGDDDDDGTITFAYGDILTVASSEVIGGRRDETRAVCCVLCCMFYFSCLSSILFGQYLILVYVLSSVQVFS